MSSPYISLLLPTRNRVNSLKDAIHSAITMADDPSQVEILLRVDTDDRATIDALPTLPFQNNIKYIVGDRRGGYSSIHEFQTELCKISSGEWLMIYSDDSLIDTKNWDLLFRPYHTELPFALFHQGRDFYTFPCINRAWFNITGIFSRTVYSDGYVWYIAERTGTYAKIPINFVHRIENHPLTIGRDQTLEDKEKWQKEDRLINSHVAGDWARSVPQIHQDFLLIREYIYRKTGQPL